MTNPIIKTVHAENHICKIYYKTRMICMYNTPEIQNDHQEQQKKRKKKKTDRKKKSDFDVFLTTYTLNSP